MPVAHCYVVGSPIRHSRSPLIHRLFAEQFGYALRYDRREVQPGTLGTAVAEFQQQGVRGINVTIPLKEEACSLANRRSARAQAAGAANVLTFEADGSIEADNTDGLGMVRDLEAHGIALPGRRVMMLGAGGAARGVVPALLDAGVAGIVVVNRTAAKAASLVEAFAGYGAVSAHDPATPCASACELLVNATSAGLTSTTPPPVPPGAADADTVCYDLVYASGETAFLAWARDAGIRRRIDGLGMLVEQAAAAFERWHGLRPETAPVISALRERL